jgi:folate-binding protein YgfZ
VIVGEERLLVIASRDFGWRGYDLLFPTGLTPRVIDAAQLAGLQEISPARADILRIEAGRPRFGIDMTADTIPLEAGIEDRAISMTKGCYVGQEVIVRVLHRGHGRVARRLVGLRAEGSDALAAGSAIRSDGRAIGAVTSAAVSPEFGSIALGYVQRDFTQPDTRVEVGGDEAHTAATVVALPFRRFNA